MPSVARFSIAPVRSLGLLHPDEIQLTRDGVAEDRRFYLIDDAGRLVDGLVVGELVTIATWTDPEATTLRMTMPDGTVVEDEVHVVDPVETPVYGRIAQGHVVEGPWGAALSELAGRPIRVVRADRIGGTRSEHPATLIGDGSLGRLGYQLGTGTLDGRRFRMLIDLADADEHEEDTWIGRTIELGEAVLSISGPVARCAMTTHDPDSGRRDLDTLRAIREYRGMRDGKKLDFGVFGEVEREGRIHVGDAVRVMERTAAT